jgi:hypothetical protein
VYILLSADALAFQNVHSSRDDSIQYSSILYLFTLLFHSPKANYKITSQFNSVREITVKHSPAVYEDVFPRGSGHVVLICDYSFSLIDRNMNQEPQIQ